MWRQTLCFLLLVFVSVSFGWKMAVPPVVTVSRGEDAVLSCSLTSGKTGYSGKIVVKWMARERTATPFFQCCVKNDSMEEPNPCADSGLKYSLAGDPRHGELSLLIRKVELSDNGIFFCRVELDVNVGWNIKHLEGKTELKVEAQPQIVSLSVVDAPSSPDSSPPRMLQCEAEGHPVPIIVWLSASGLTLDDKGQTRKHGPYRTISCIPYLEEDDQVFTCRAENSLGHAKRRFPPEKDHLMIILIICGVIGLTVVILSAVILVYCLKKHSRRRDSNSPTDGGQELQPVYSEVSSSTPWVTSVSSTQRSEHTVTTYSYLKAPR